MSVSYSTLPLALRGARAISVMTALCGIGGIDLAGGAADQLFIGTDSTEHAAIERWRFDLGDGDLCDARLRAEADNNDECANKSWQSSAEHGRFPKISALSRERPNWGNYSKLLAPK